MHLWSRFINQDHTSFEVWYLESYILIILCIKGGRKNRIVYINKLYIRISCMAVSLLLLWTQLDWKGALWIIFYSFSKGCSLLRSRTWTPFCLPSCAQICQIHIYLPTSNSAYTLSVFKIFCHKKHIANVAHVQLINYPF